MRIRLTGTRAESEQAVAALHAGFAVFAVSGFYPNRRAAPSTDPATAERGRVYLDAEPHLTPVPGAAPGTANTRTDKEIPPCATPHH